MTANEIKELRNKLGITQRVLAEKLNVSFETVNRWETGRFKPSKLAERQLLRLLRKSKDGQNGLDAIDKTVEKIEQGNAWEKTDGVVQADVKRSLDKVVPVRLPADKWEQMRKEARELGVGPTTLARMWILEHLRQQVNT